MKGFAALATALSGLLVGLGIAITAKTVSLLGFDDFGIGYVIGPGLVLVGVLRMRLQKRLTAGDDGEGSDGNPS